MRFRCYNCYLKKKDDGQAAEWQGDVPVCPRCKANPPLVVSLVDVHLLVDDPKGAIGTVFRRYTMACRPERDKLATPDTPSMTGDANAVTCPNCKLTKAYREALALRKEYTLRGPKVAGDPSCC